MTDAQIDEWVRTTRHKVMYKDESKIDLVPASPAPALELVSGRIASASSSLPPSRRREIPACR